MTEILVKPEMLNRIGETFIHSREQLEQVYVSLDKQMNRVHQEWSGVTRENFFQAFRSFQEQRKVTLDQISYVGEELIQISKKFAEADAKVTNTDKPGLNLNLMINEQKMGYARAKNDEERMTYRQEAERIRTAMRDQGYAESDILQDTDPFVSEKDIMELAWDETYKNLDDDTGRFGPSMIEKVVAKELLTRIEDITNKINDLKAGHADQVISEEIRNYVDFYTGLGYKSAEVASDLERALDDVANSSAKEKTEAIVGLASGLIFGKHSKKGKHTDGENSRKEKENGGSERKGDSGSTTKLTEPSLPKGSKPSGNYATGDSHGIRKQNETANFLADQGYDIKMLDEIDGGNGYGIKEGSNPDFLIEGKVFDCYAPKPDGKVQSIIKELAGKSKNQSERIVLNLDNFPDGKVDEIIATILRKANPNGDLKRIDELSIVRGGTIRGILGEEK